MENELSSLCYLSRGVRRYGNRPVLENRRGEWEYELILSGGCHPTLHGRPLPSLPPPVLWVFRPDSCHGWSAPEDDVSEVMVLHFEWVPGLLARNIPEASGVGVTLDVAEAHALIEECSALEATYRRSDPAALLAFARMNLSLALSHLRHRPPQERASDTGHARRKVTQAMNWMRQHLTEAPTVEQAAEAVGVSGTHLRRLFRECLGTTPRAELEKMRLSAADELIRTGRHSLAQISDLLGYSEPSAFSRAYKRHHHRPPSGSRVK